MRAPVFFYAATTPSLLGEPSVCSEIFQTLDTHDSRVYLVFIFLSGSLQRFLVGVHYVAALLWCSRGKIFAYCYYYYTSELNWFVRNYSVLVVEGSFTGSRTNAGGGLIPGALGG